MDLLPLCSFYFPLPFFGGLLVADLVFVPTSMAVLILLLKGCPVMQLLLLATNLQVFQISDLAGQQLFFSGAFPLFLAHWFFPLFI